MGVSGAFSPKNDNASSPPSAFVFGNGFISSTGALFLNIPLESCEKSVYVFPVPFYDRLALSLEISGNRGKHKLVIVTAQCYN